MVIVYTKNKCSKCKATKMVLSTLGVDAEYRNIDENEQYMADVLQLKDNLAVNTLEMPIVMRDYDVIVSTGFFPDKLNEAFGAV